MSASAVAEHVDHHDDHSEQDNDEHYGHASSGKLGMWIFLLSDAFSFSGLLLAYGILRGQSAQWIPSSLPDLGINFTAGMTFLLICSSVTMVLAHAACVDGDRKKTAMFLALTALGGFLFLGGQVYEYTHLMNQGMGITKGPYSSSFFVITSFHGAHVFTGTMYILVMLVNTLRGKYDGGKHNSIEVCGLFWHFVDLVWILVFTFVYLVPT